MSDQPKVALITGVTGQDGAYLSELLPYKRYEGHGIKRRSRLAVSFETSEYTAKADGIGTPRIVEAWHADSGLTTTASKPRAHLTTRRHTVGERN